MKSIDRLHEKSIPIPESGCLLWLGACTDRGYGNISVGNKKKYVHRLMWELIHGEIPKNMDVCHKCDVRSCMEPSHLFLGTRKDNMQDAKRKGKTTSGIKNHFCKLTDEQVTEIRVLYKKGVRQYILAKRFGLSRGHVSELVNGNSRA